MADENLQPVPIAKGVVPIEADTTVIDRQMDDLSDRADELREKFGTIVDPLLEKLGTVEELSGRLFGGQIDQSNLLEGASDPQPGRDGGSVQHLGIGANISDLGQLTIAVEDNTETMRRLIDVIQQLITSSQT
jgi:hypothetical protein